MTAPDPAIAAQAHLHHQYFLGLQLMVSVREGPAPIGEWIYRLFRRQHEEKFLSSFDKLGLRGLPDAVACARYHVLSNSVGGVMVEYMEESETKAWVRFRYPRWMFDGPAICGIPPEAGRGFLRGWYARNGITLGNPRLGFVCVSEDLTGQYGFCGYFREYEEPLSDDQRLRFAPDERPPPFDPACQPKPPAAEWSPERLEKANRNYAVEYVRNGLMELPGVLGRDRARELAAHAAWLTGLQQYARLARMVGGRDGDAQDAAAFLAEMFRGMGDAVEDPVGQGAVTLHHASPRILRGLQGSSREDVRDAWIELWRGTVNAHRAFLRLEAADDAGGLSWTVTPDP